MDYKELHIFDFDDTLYKTPQYDSNGVNSKYLQLVLANVKNYVQQFNDRFPENINPELFSLVQEPILDLDDNNRYEILYNGNPIQDKLFKCFNRKVRDYIERGEKVGINANPQSYYIVTNKKWYETSISLPDIQNSIIQSTRQEFDKSVSRNDIYTVIMTGRNISLKHYVQKILQSNALYPDALLLSPGGSTIKFKTDEILRIIGEHPTIDKVVVWEDRSSQANKFKVFFEKLMIDYKINMVPKYYLQEFIVNFAKLFCKQHSDVE